VAEHTILKPRWERKFAEGKMFERLECDRCRAKFNFGQSTRVSRVPRCPACGSLASHPRAA
jgi:NAD-dependent SIR2 family protein deacetylase